MNQELLKEWKKIANQIRKHDKKYAHGIPLISDTSYDALRNRLQDIENIIGVQKNSPLHKIGEVEENTIQHNVQMLSLDHGYGAESISAFYKKIGNAIKNFIKMNHKFNEESINQSNEKIINQSKNLDKYDDKTSNQSKNKSNNKSHDQIDKIFSKTMILEHKIDGIAISVRYKNGKLDYVITRGDGQAGIDITEQSKYIHGIQKTFPIDEFEIRGEIYMTFQDFEKTSGFKNPRNATAGIIRNKEMGFISSHNLKFIAHGFVDNGNFKFYSEAIDFIKNAGFQVPNYKISKSEKESIEIFENIDRDEVAYPIDGIVLKLNDLELCKKLGNHRTAPRYAFAAKFPPKNSWTKIIKIDFQVGKFGTITPVAEVSPIEIDGIEIKKVSVHNMMELKNKNYNIGDEVVIARAGDVIPYILQKKEVVINCNSDQTNDSEVSLQQNQSLIPSLCPECNSELIWDSVTMKCTNGWNCKQQALLRIEHFVSRKAMNINGLGNKNIEKLYDTQILQKPNDIFKICELVLNNDFMIKKLLGAKVAQNIYDSIQKNKEISLNKFIYSLCIPNVGYGIAKTISDHCKTFENFICTFSEEEISIPSIGPVIIESIKKFISQEKWIFDLHKNLKIN